VILGAVVINVSFEFLEPQNPHPDFKRLLFYATIVLLVARLKPWWRGLLILGGTLAFGFATWGIVNAISPSWTSGTPTDLSSHAFSTALSHWVIIPDPLVHGNFGNYCYVALVVAAIAVRSLTGWWRTIALIPTLYLTAVVWENVLAPNPSVTAQILFGVMLIVLMTARPQGLLGTARVEIV
jgi:ABC-type branched-subunit amino acid transport system permease subunit